MHREGRDTNTDAHLPRKRSGRVRARVPSHLAKQAGHVVLACLLGFAFALSPYVKLGYLGLYVDSESQKAEAIAPVAGAYGFLEALAVAGGMTVPEFVGTSAAMLGTLTGACIIQNDIELAGTSVDNTLHKLVNTAEWPSWEQMSETTRSEWGTRENYEAAQFNTYLSALGFSDYRDSWYSSGGGNLDEGAQSLSQRVAAIGRQWIDGYSVPYVDLESLLDPGGVQEMEQGLFPTWQVTVQTGSSASSTGVRYVSVGNKLDVYYSNHSSGTGDLPGFVSNEIVYLMPAIDGLYVYPIMFSGSPFTMTYYAANGNGATATTSSYEQDGKTVYYVYQKYRRNYSVRALNVPAYQGEVPNAYAKYMCWSALYGENDLTLSNAQLPGYDEDEIEPYAYPKDGIFGPTVNFGDLFSSEPVQPSQPIVRPDNDYNPNDQTGNAQWRDDTTNNVLPLANIHFENLFPFSLMFDVRDLSSKVSDLTVGQVGSGDYTVLRIPVVVPGIADEELELDLTPVHNLLVMVRPFVLVLLTVALVMSLVLFWRSILTGD